jgi:hypothetical protein
MSQHQPEFRTATELEDYWARHPGSPVFACLLDMFAYPSFFMEVVLRKARSGVRIEVDYRSYAMDMHGEATHVAVHYEVATLADALAWLNRRLLHTLADCRTSPIPLPAGYPRTSGHTRRLQAAWRRLRADFQNGKGRLIDKKLAVVWRFDGR